MRTTNKIVFYKKHCPTCKHEAVEETEEPCNSCLDCPVREDTHKPEKWEERE